MGRVEYLNDPAAPKPNSLVPACGVLAVDDAGRVLLQRRRDTGQWAIPMGKQELGETPSQCAIRETLEETGLIVQPGEIVGLYSRLEAAVVVLAFEARVVGGEPRLNPEAHTHIGQGRHSLIPLPRNRATPGAPARGPVHRPAQHDATEREGARNNCGIHGGHATAGRAGPRQLPAAPARPTTSPAGAQDSGGPSGGNSTAPSASTAWRLVR